MKRRKTFPMSLACALMALGVVIAPALADELVGRITKVDLDSRSILVVEKGTDLEIKVKVKADTVAVTPKGEHKVELEKMKETLEKAKQGIPATITHQKGIASKITYASKARGLRKGRD